MQVADEPARIAHVAVGRDQGQGDAATGRDRPGSRSACRSRASRRGAGCGLLVGVEPVGLAVEAEAGLADAVGVAARRSRRNRASGQRNPRSGRGRARRSAARRPTGTRGRGSRRPRSGSAPRRPAGLRSVISRISAPSTRPKRSTRHRSLTPAKMLAGRPVTPASTAKTWPAIGSICGSRPIAAVVM